MKDLCLRPVTPGVLAYDGDEVVGWAAVAPRLGLPFARSRKIPHVDDLPKWSVWCVIVRPGHRRQGISRVVLSSAPAIARPPAIEGYPVDNHGEKANPTMVYMSTRGLCESVGFVKVAVTDPVSGGFPRVVMSLDLRELVAL